MERLTRIAKRSAAFVGIVYLLLLVAGTSLEFLVPKEQLRALCVQKLQERLKRQVRLTSVSIGPWRGLRVEGLEISEAPDFEAGTFLSAERLSVKPKFLPLALGRMAVGEVQLVAPKLRVVRFGGPDQGLGAARYNFTGLIEAESKAQGAAGPGSGLPPMAYTPAAAPRGGAAALPVAGSTRPAGIAPLRDDFDKPKPRKKDLLTALSTGWDDPQRKLVELGALAAGAAASAATKLQVDFERLRVRRGALEFIDEEARIRLEAAEVSVWAEGLTPNSARTDVDLGGRLSGTLQDEKTEAEFTVDARMLLDRGYYPVKSAGHLVLNKIRHPNFTTERIRADWDLEGLSPDLKTAKGVVKLEGSPGQLDKPAYLGRQGKWPALLLYPIEVLAKFRGLGLPDLLKIPYNELKGEYAFQAGSVNLAPVYVRGPLVSINAEGAVHLMERTVDLKANVVMGKSSVGVFIKGPMDSPRVEGEVALKPTVKRRAAPQAKESGDILEQAFGDPDGMVEDPARPRASRTAGGRPKELDRKHTIKDAESLIDAPLPEE